MMGWQRYNRMGVRRHTGTHQDQNGKVYAAEDDVQHQNGVEGTRTQKIFQKKCIPTAPKARSLQRQGSRLGSISRRRRVSALAVTFLFAFVVRSFLLREVQECPRVSATPSPEWHWSLQHSRYCKTKSEICGLYASPEQD